MSLTRCYAGACFLLMLSLQLAQEGADTATSGVCKVGAHCQDANSEVSNATGEVTAQLFDWIIAEGGKINGAEMQWLSATHRRLVASADLPEGSELISVPARLIIDSKRAAATPLGQALLTSQKEREILGDMPDVDGFLMALWTMQEAAKDNSTFASYIAALPKWFPGMPLNFTDEEFALCFQSFPELAERAKTLRRSFAREWQVLQEIAGEAFGREQFLWARLVSFSRTFTISRLMLSFDQTLETGPRHTTPYLEVLLPHLRRTSASPDKDEEGVYIPVADMINQGRGKEINCDWTYTGAEGFQVVAKRQLTAGEELFISYGSLKTAAQLLHYGFVEWGNPHDSVEVTLPLPALRDTDDIEGLSQAADGQVSLHIDGAKPANIELIKAVLDAARAEARRKSPSIGARMLEQSALQILRRIFDEQLQEYEPRINGPQVCAALRRNRQAMLGIWHRFVEVAITYLDGSWPPSNSSLPPRFDLHARLYLGVWLRTTGRDFPNEHFYDTAEYGQVSYIDLFSFDHE